MKTEGVADRIAAFRAHCADTEHTDTGGAWDLLNDAEVMLRCAADEMRSKVLKPSGTNRRAQGDSSLAAQERNSGRQTDD
jgi:hypothetical protein